MDDLFVETKGLNNKVLDVLLNAKWRESNDAWKASWNLRHTACQGRDIRTPHFLNCTDSVQNPTYETAQTNCELLQLKLNFSDLKGEDAKWSRVVAEELEGNSPTTWSGGGRDTTSTARSHNIQLRRSDYVQGGTKSPTMCHKSENRKIGHHIQ